MRVPGKLSIALVAVAAAMLVGPGAPPASAAVTLVDNASAAGLYEVNHTWSAKTVDYDNDGDEDIWVGYHQWSGKLWRNNGNGTYTRVAADAWPRRNSEGKQPDRHDCAWGFVNNDSLIDAYCSAGRNQSNLVKTGMDNELWLQNPVGTFTDVGTQWGVGDVCGRGRHVTFINANGDKWPDLVLGNETPRNVSNDRCDNPANGLPSEESKLFLNNGGTGFTQAPASWGISGYGITQRCIEVFDANGDGWPDMIGCRLKNQTPRLFISRGGTGFTDMAASWGLTTAISDATPADLNKDGRMDLVFSTRGDFSYRLNMGTRFGPSVRIRAVTGGEGRSVAVGDIDGDGDLDVYGLVSNPNHSSNPNDVVLINNGSLSFTALTVPAAGGDGDEVIAVHPSLTGPASFLVLNGGDAGSVGPIQLIQARVT